MCTQNTNEELFGECANVNEKESRDIETSISFFYHQHYTLVLSSFVCNHNQTIYLIALWFDNNGTYSAGKHTRHNRNEIGNTNEYIVCACADTITCPQFSEKTDSTRLELSGGTPVPFHVPNEYFPFYANEESHMCSRSALCIHTSASGLDDARRLIIQNGSDDQL